MGENFLQHADHFMRIIEDKNKNNKVKDSDKTFAINNSTPENNSNLQEQVNKNKE